jgi:hypothetical protein
MENAYNILIGKVHSEYLGVGGKIILEWILGKQYGNLWTGFIWLRKGISGGAVVNTLMNLLVPYKVENFLTRRMIEGLCSVQFSSD